MELFLFMTTSASLLICITLLLRPLTGRVFPRVTQMILWIAAALRLLIPVKLHSPIGVLERTSVQPQNISAPTYSVTPTTPSAVPHVTVAPEIITVPTAAEPTVSAPTASPEDILFWVWLSGAVVLFSVILFLHIRNLFWCKNKTRDRNAERIVSCNCTVYRCAAVKSPFVYGMLRPRIVLPVQVSSDDLLAVLAHEAAHIRRLDILKKYLFAAALCVQWFNPLVWLMVYFSAQDMEILCDAHALLMPGAPNAKAYAHALLNAEERRTVFNLGFKSNTEVRIMKILKKDKHNRILMLVSVLLAVLLVTACTTAAEIPPVLPEPESSSSEAEAVPTPTPPPATETIMQPLLNKEPAEPVQDLFVKDGAHGFGGLQIGMNWEDAKPIITELTGNETPVLPETDGYQTAIAFPYSVFGYDATVTVAFATNSKRIAVITCTLPLEGNAAIEAAYNNFFERFSEQFGSPTESYDTVKDHTWYLPDCRLALSCYPIGTNYTEKESVNICIVPNPEKHDEITGFLPQSVPANTYIEINSERDAHIALEFINAEIYQLEQEKNYIAQLLNTQEQEDEEYLGYRHAALDILGENADEHDIRVQIAWLKAEDALGFISRSLPDTEGKECMKINIKREDTDEVLSSHIVPKDEYTQYLEKFRIETAEADVYVSFTSVD